MTIVQFHAIAVLLRAEREIVVDHLEVRAELLGRLRSELLALRRNPQSAASQELAGRIGDHERAFARMRDNKALSRGEYGGLWDVGTIASAYNIRLAYYGLDAPGLTNKDIVIPVVEGRDCDPLLIVILRGSHFTAPLPTHHCGLELAQDPASAQRQQWKEESADLHRRCRGSCV